MITRTPDPSVFTARCDRCASALKKARAKITKLEAENAALRFRIAASPTYPQATEVHPWDIE